MNYMMVNLISLSFLSAITENHRLGGLETTNISHSFGGWQSRYRPIRCLVRTCLLDHSYFLDMSSHGRRGEGAVSLGPLMRTNPIDEGSDLMTRSFPRGSTSRYQHVWD